MSLRDQPHFVALKANLARVGVWPEQSKFRRIIRPLMMMAAFLTLGGPMLKVIVKNMERHWEMFKDKSEAIVLAKYAERGRYFTALLTCMEACANAGHLCGYLTFVYITTSLYLILSLHPIFLDFIVPLNETREKIYVFQAEYGVDQDKYYWFIICHGYIVAVIGLLAIIAFETGYIIFIVHACTLFEVVVFVERIQSILSGWTVMTIGLGVLLVSLGGMQVLINLNDPMGLIQGLTLCLSVVFHVYVNTIPGQQLIDHSQKICTFSYNVNWYNMNVKTQKLWILILIRSNKPCFLVAGKVYIMSMECFRSTVQTAFSYFTVLAQLL